GILADILKSLGDNKKHMRECALNTLDLWLTIVHLDNMVMKVSRLALLPANPNILEGVDDLIQLSYLNEPSVLYNLKSHYAQDLIYLR
ncbi:hypothetical protein HN51_012259, partial [Arachis hypogaea]